MAGLCLGSELRSRIRPRLPTATRVISRDSARIDGSARPKFWYGVGSTYHWRSGAGSDGSVRLKPPASAIFVVSGPECVIRQRARFFGPAFSHSPVVFGVCHIAVTMG